MASESKSDNPPEAFYDLPPDSFCVATADEQDWFDRNAVMQRKTSLKLGFNRNSNSSSHVLVSGKSSKPSLLGLPKAQKSFGLDRNAPEKKAGRSLFRSRSEPGGKPVVQAVEPGSPRVSCTGRVGFKSCDDGKKTGFSRLLGSLFRSRTQKTRSRKCGNGDVR